MLGRCYPRSCSTVHWPGASGRLLGSQLLFSSLFPPFLASTNNCSFRIVNLSVNRLLVAHNILGDTSFPFGRFLSSLLSCCFLLCQSICSAFLSSSLLSPLLELFVVSSQFLSICVSISSYFSSRLLLPSLPTLLSRSAAKKYPSNLFRASGFLVCTYFLASPIASASSACCAKHFLCIDRALVHCCAVEELLSASFLFDYCSTKHIATLHCAAV